MDWYVGMKILYGVLVFSWGKQQTTKQRQITTNFLLYCCARRMLITIPWLVLPYGESFVPECCTYIDIVVLWVRGNEWYPVCTGGYIVVVVPVMSALVEREWGGCRGCHLPLGSSTGRDPSQGCCTGDSKLKLAVKLWSGSIGTTQGIVSVLLPENLHTYLELSAQAWTLYKAP
jgi:hypothetical protein